MQRRGPDLGRFATFDDAMAAAKKLSAGTDLPAISISDHWWDSTKERFILDQIGTMQNTFMADVHFEGGKTSAGGWFDVPIIDAKFGDDRLTILRYAV